MPAELGGEGEGTKAKTTFPRPQAMHDSNGAHSPLFHRPSQLA